MPLETENAVEWALTQQDEEGNAVNKDTPYQLVDRVREYFNANQIAYSTFCYTDLLPYLGPQEPEGMPTGE